MATVTIPAAYRQGKIIPLRTPPFESPDEVIVTFVKYAPGAQAPEEDPDEAIFRKNEPRYRKIRREVFKEMYPTLYEKYYGKNSAESGD